MAGGSGKTPGAHSGEDALITRLFEPIATHPGALGLKDDAACMAVPAGHELVMTKDALVAGVHFFPDDPPDAIARKSLRVNLSDLAAKGAAPLGVLLAIAIPEGMSDTALAAFARGLGEDCRAFGAPLMGGDTVRTPGPLTVSITALGTVPTGSMVHRACAKEGQVIVVTGTIGDGALGLALRLSPDRPGFKGLDKAAKAHLLDRYLHPRPRLALAAALRDHAGAAMDVSDGLVGDLAKMLGASSIAGEIELARVPLSAAARAAILAEPELLETAVTGGDDYEILAVMPEERLESFHTLATFNGIGLAVIGRTLPGQGLVVRDLNGAEMVLARTRYSHF